MKTITYPLFGIIYNWKGLKEENYLYTAEELKKFDEELYNMCIEDPNQWFDSPKIECAWKTWMGTLIKDECELKRFIGGYYNDKPSESDADWYWENVMDNDLYGVKSDTMKDVLEFYSFITLTTYGYYEEKGDVQHELEFDVPRWWLEGYVYKNGYKSVEEFLDTYTWDTTMDTYARALEDKVINYEKDI